MALKLRKLTTKEAFESLKKGDLLVVEYEKPLEDKIMDSFFITVINSDKEVIINHKKNYYFKYDMYLRGTSHVTNAYLVQPLDAQIDLSEIENYITSEREYLTRQNEVLRYDIGILKQEKQSVLNNERERSTSSFNKIQKLEFVNDVLLSKIKAIDPNFDSTLIKKLLV